jgi:bacterioferritin
MTRGRRSSTDVHELARPLQATAPEDVMPAETRSSAAVARANDSTVTREQLIGLLNEDLAREYQAVIAYVVYSQVLKGAEFMSIAKELEVHANEELQHAHIVSKLIDYLGGMPTVTPLPVKTSEKAEEMLRFDLENENDTVRAYRERVRQCELLGEYAMAEQIREILVQEQEHQIDLATALGIDVPDVSKART